MFRENQAPFSKEMNGVETEKVDEKFVIDAFKRLAPDFEIEKNPGIIDKLVKTGEHFKDAIEIAQMMVEMSDENESEKNRSALIGLVHDIGKYGPIDAEPEVNAVIQELFVQKKFKTKPNIPVAEFLEAEKGNFADIEKIIQVLENDLKINTKELPMIELWRMHAQWTWDILSQPDSGVDVDVATIAASHHILEGKNPANLDMEEIPEEAALLETIDKYTLLTMVDKYQAFIDRGGVSHEKAIELIGKMIDSCQTIDEKLRGRYHKMLQKLDKDRQSEKDFKIAV